MDVVSFNEVSSVRPSVSRDSERTYGSIAIIALLTDERRPLDRPL